VEGVGIDAATKQPWILLQLLDGETLDAKVLREGALTTETARDLARELGHALKAAHGAGVIHRDLKPGNLFLARRGDVQRSVVLKVLDFGLAGIINPDESRLQNTRLAGSLAWAAPEQGESDARMGPEVDVWPLGLLAFWMLTGKHYWRTMNADDMSEMKLMREINFDPLDASRGDDLASARARRHGVGERIPEGFDAWFARCVARDPKARWRDGGEASDALDRVLERASQVPPLSSAPPVPLEPLLATRERGYSPTTPLVAPPPAPPLASPPAPSQFEGTVDVVSDPARPRGAPPREHTFVAEEQVPVPPEVRPRVDRRVLVAAGVALFVAGAGGIWRVVKADEVRPSPLPAPACPAGMTLVPAGSVDLRDGETTRRVSLSAFCIDARQVAQGDYARCVAAGGDNGCAPANDAWWDGATDAARGQHRTLCAAWSRDAGLPIACVSWDMAQHYCQTRNARLPTEAQWERAARGDDGRAFPWGNDAPTAARMNGCGLECFATTHPPGGATAGDVLYLADDRVPYVTAVTHEHFSGDRSPFGVVGLGGNVQEWTADCSAPITEGAAQDRAVTCAEDTRPRVVRGGGWSTIEADAAKATFRLPLLPATQMADVGFRCVADVIRAR